MGWTLAIVQMVKEEGILEQGLEGSEGGSVGAEGTAGLCRGCSGESEGPVCLGGVSEGTKVSVLGVGWEQTVQATEGTLDLAPCELGRMLWTLDHFRRVTTSDLHFKMIVLQLVDCRGAKAEAWRPGRRPRQ